MYDFGFAVISSVDATVKYKDIFLESLDYPDLLTSETIFERS